MNLFTVENVMPILLVCCLIFFLLFLRPKHHVLLKGIMKIVLGFILIVGANLLCQNIGLQVQIGINPLTLLTSTILGIPGVVGLFVLFYL